MSNLLKDIDARTQLAGNNKLEVLMFTLGKATSRSIDLNRSEIYGINVFKVREVMRTPPITETPNLPQTIKGIVSLRGELVPVIDLVEHLGRSIEHSPQIMIVTEYNGQTQGFLVEGVDTILRLDWAKMRVPPEILNSQAGGLITAVTELTNGRLVMMIDVEKILAETGEFDQKNSLKNVEKCSIKNRKVFFADDSVVALRQIESTLTEMGIQYEFATNGKLAWEALLKIAELADAQEVKVSELIQLILTDVEMPEMDGYLLTKKIKDDKRFSGIPVVMHSSLSSDSNRQLGKNVGVDEYVPKFNAENLSHTILSLIS